MYIYRDKNYVGNPKQNSHEVYYLASSPGPAQKFILPTAAQTFYMEPLSGSTVQSCFLFSVM